MENMKNVHALQIYFLAGSLFQNAYDKHFQQKKKSLQHTQFLQYLF